MKKELEWYLWDNIRSSKEMEPLPRETISRMLDLGMIKSEKQAWATLRKWLKQRKYDFGVSLDLGWKEE